MRREAQPMMTEGRRAEWRGVSWEEIQMMAVVRLREKCDKTPEMMMLMPETTGC